jgi:hypothetical protein
MPHHSAAPDRAQLRHQRATSRKAHARLTVRRLVISLFHPHRRDIRRPHSRDSTAAAARRNGKNGFHQNIFFPKHESSDFSRCGGHVPHNAAVGVKPGQAAVMVAPVRPRMIAVSKAKGETP